MTAPVDPVDHYEEQRRKAEEVVRLKFVFTVDEGDLEELAERQNTEGERHAALLEITRMIRRREREKEMETEK